jgi:hypothetical protein
MSQSGRPLLGNIYNKNAYFSGNWVKCSGNEYANHRGNGTVKLKDSTRGLLDRPSDGYNRHNRQSSRAELVELRRRQREEVQNR